jgi:hypothetical protein
LRWKRYSKKRKWSRKAEEVPLNDLEFNLLMKR